MEQVKPNSKKSSNMNKSGWSVMEEESGPLGLTGIWNWLAELWLSYYTVAFTSNIRSCLETSLKRVNIENQRTFCIYNVCIYISFDKFGYQLHIIVYAVV